jgi:hypothetical protein
LPRLELRFVATSISNENKSENAGIFGGLATSRVYAFAKIFENLELRICPGKRLCVFASEAHNSARRGELDDTGLECFVNHLHFESLAEAVEFARRLKSALTERFSDRFAVVVSFDGRDATVRFHKQRAGEEWLHDNLDSYLDEGIAVFD